MVFERELDLEDFNDTAELKPPWVCSVRLFCYRALCGPFMHHINVVNFIYKDFYPLLWATVNIA